MRGRMGGCDSPSALLLATSFVGVVLAAGNALSLFLKRFGLRLKSGPQVAIALAFYSPLWAPIAVAAYSAGRRKFDLRTLVVLIAAEVAAFGLVAIAIQLYDYVMEIPGPIPPVPP